MQITEHLFQLYSSMCTTNETACNPQEILIVRLSYHAIKLAYYYFCTLSLIWIPNTVYYKQNSCIKIDTFYDHRISCVEISTPALINWPFYTAILYTGVVMFYTSGPTVHTYNVNNVANITTLVFKLFALRHQNLYAFSIMSNVSNEF